MFSIVNNKRFYYLAKLHKNQYTIIKEGDFKMKLKFKEMEE
ncbi:MAG TPA: hypothetical protein PK566_04635 [Pseudobacteroides sp.]|nr:hypothetical protein [Pseudobacteroides sp.]